MSSKKQWKPGEDAEYDLQLNAVDAQGNVLGTINVPKGNRVPPTRFEEAVGYEEA